MNSPVQSLEISAWTAEAAESASHFLEAGKVLLLPRLGFELTESERVLLTSQCTDGKAKNISYDPATRNLRGSMLAGLARTTLAGMTERFYRQTRLLLETLAPLYAPHLQPGLTSYRPVEIAGRRTSKHKDDMRLHVDAFASRPNQGLRILRVFSNINPGGQPRVWEIGEPFNEFAARYAPHVERQLPGSAWLLDALRITKGRRSEYDHIMLHLHDRIKSDAAYQASAPRVRIEFPAGSTWIVFTDRVMHAALAGQHALEQTFYLPVSAMRNAQYAPLRVLEQLYQRKLT